MLIRIRAAFGCLLLLSPVPLSAQEAAVSPRSENGQAITLLQQLDNGFAAVFEQVAPSVVVIRSEGGREERDRAPSPLDLFLRGPNSEPLQLPESSKMSEGSGFIIRSDGYIVTNNHVIENGEKLEVRLKDGRRFDAEVVGSDNKTDIAVIKIEAASLPAAELGDSEKVRIGQLVFAIGVPFNLDYSFSGGWVSAKGRTNLLGSTDPRIMYEDYIQTDTFINPGNSGGPLFDVNGRIIGMNSFINGIGRGLAFAIPSNMLKDVTDQLIATGNVTRPWVGINMVPDEEAADQQLLRDSGPGVVVKTILPETPAYQSDLRPLDMIVAVDGTPVRSTNDMQREVLRKKVGDTLQLTVVRKGAKVVIPITTAALPANPRELAESGPRQPDRSEPSDQPGLAERPESPARADHGLQMQDLNGDLAKQLGLDSSAGALVTDVAENSAAAEAGVKRGDLITEIDSNPVRDSEQARHMLKERDVDQGILLFIHRKGEKTYAVLKTQS